MDWLPPAYMWRDAAQVLTGVLLWRAYMAHVRMASDRGKKQWATINTYGDPYAGMTAQAKAREVLGWQMKVIQGTLGSAEQHCAALGLHGQWQEAMSQLSILMEAIANESANDGGTAGTGAR